MKAQPLEDLLEKMRAGDVQAAEQVFLAYEPELRLIVRRRLSRRLRAKFDSLDVVQSVWLRVLGDFDEKGCRLDSPLHLRRFLVRITRNCFIDRLRHYRRALECEVPLPEAGAASAMATGQP